MSQRDDDQEYGWLHGREEESESAAPILYNTAARVGIDPWKDQILRRELTAWVDELSSRLKQRDPEAGAWVIAVTDLVEEPGGRARLAIVVSGLLAERGFGVTLVDADLRYVGLAQFLRLQSEDAEGFVDALQYGASIAGLLLPTQAEGVRALPVGSYRPDHAEVLTDEDLRRVAAQLRAVGDVVLTVSPSRNVDDRFHPLLLHADEVLLGFDLDRSLAPALEELREYLRGLGIPLAALVPRVDSDAPAAAVDVALSPASEPESSGPADETPYRKEPAPSPVPLEDDGRSSPIFRGILLMMVLALLGFVGWWGWMELSGRPGAETESELAELSPWNSPSATVPQAEPQEDVAAVDSAQALSARADDVASSTAGESFADAPAGDASGTEEPTTSEETGIAAAAEESARPLDEADEPAGSDTDRIGSEGAVAPAVPAEIFAPVGGGWALHPLSFADSTDAVGALPALEREGMQPQVRRALVNGQVWYRVLVGRFESRSEASEAREILAEMVDTDWVGVVRVR